MITRQEFFARSWKDRCDWAKSVDRNSFNAFNASANERIERGKERRQSRQ